MRFVRFILGENMKKCNVATVKKQEKWVKDREDVKKGVYLHGPIKKVVHYHMHFFKINCGFIVISFQNLGKQQTWAPRQCTSLID